MYKVPAKELDHFLFAEIFCEQTQETRTRVYASNNFQFSTQNCPEWKGASNCCRERRGGLTLRLPLQLLISCVYVWMIFTATNSSSIFCDAQEEIFHAGSTEITFRISTNCSCWDLWHIPLQIVLQALVIFNMIYVHWICFQTRGTCCLYFSFAHVIQNTRRKPFEWPEVHFNRK